MDEKRTKSSRKRYPDVMDNPDLTRVHRESSRLYSPTKSLVDDDDHMLHPRLSSTKRRKLNPEQQNGRVVSESNGFIEKLNEREKEYKNGSRIRRILQSRADGLLNESSSDGDEFRVSKENYEALEEEVCEEECNTRIIINSTGKVLASWVGRQRGISSKYFTKKFSLFGRVWRIFTRKTVVYSEEKRLR